MGLLSFTSDMNIVSFIFIGPDLCLRRDSGSKIIKCDFLLLPLEIKQINKFRTKIAKATWITTMKKLDLKNKVRFH